MMKVIHNASKKRRLSTQGGFTLVEILIASAVFAVGFIVVLATEIVAIEGVAASRDQTHAVEAGRRAIQILKAQSQQWRFGEINSSVTQKTLASEAGGAVTLVTVHNNATSAGSSATWTPLFTDPVDMMLSPSNEGRHCIYVRGWYNDGSAGSSGVQPLTEPERLLHLQVAVVYPKPHEPAASDCSRAGLMGKIKATPDGMMALELDGYRAVFLGALIGRRDYLPW